MSSRMTIGRKMFLMLTVPMASLLFFAGIEVLQRLQTQRQATDMQELTRLAVAIGAFVHEAQKERGLTGMFLGSQGQNMRHELRAQRLLTDNRLADLQALVAYVDGEHYGTGWQQDFTTARHGFSDTLGSHRAAVDALTLPGHEGVGYYTRMNAAFLRLITPMATLTSQVELSAMLNAYANFLSAKEQTSIERVTLANAFGRGTFESGEEFYRVVAAAAAQDAFLSLFLSHATPAQQALYHQKMQGQCVDEAARMRQVALDSLDKSDFGGVEAPHWFSMMTGKINLMQEVGDHLTADLVSTAARLQRQARRRLLLFVALAVGSVGLGCGYASYLSRQADSPPPGSAGKQRLGRVTSLHRADLL